MALLGCPRCYRPSGSVLQERIDKPTKAQQVIQRADELRILWLAGGRLEVRPIGGNQRFTSVRQNENELRATGHPCVP
jgi:hypothetical protein